MLYIYTDTYFLFSIFWCCRCWVVTDHILYLRFSLCIHCNTFYIILSYKFSVVFSYDIRCISMTCMHISIYMWVCGHDIFINIFNIFFNFYIFHHGYSHTNALYIKFLNGFCLPDVSSSVITVSSVVWAVFSVTLILGEDTTSNKLDICIDRC